MALHRVIWQGYGDYSLVFVLIPGVLAFGIMAVWAWLREKSKMLAYIFAGLVVVGILYLQPNSSSQEKSRDSNPCSSVAPEDRQDCLDEYYSVPTLDYSQLHQNTPEPPDDLFESEEEYDAKTNGCPKGCTIHKAGCDIRGNVSFNSGEKIYHLPGQEYYADTVVNSAYGERWFCTEDEAQANGFRRSLK